MGSRLGRIRRRPFRDGPVPATCRRPNARFIAILRCIAIPRFTAALLPAAGTWNLVPAAWAWGPAPWRRGC